jgi:twin BRCT domain
MTITNYTGGARDLVRRMVELMGATYDGSMDKKTTHVIAASWAEFRFDVRPFSH